MTIEKKSLRQIKEPDLYGSLPAFRRVGLSFTKGFASLCLADKTSNKIIAYEQWICEDQVFPAQDFRDTLATSYPWLSDPSTELILTIDAPQFSLVPSAFYDPARKETFLNLQYTPDRTGDWTYQDPLESLDAFMVYAMPLSVENRLRAAFPHIVIRHAKTFLLEKLMGIVNRHPAPELGFIHVGKDSLDVIIFKSGKLSFFNTFSYQTFDDLVYFTLLTLKDASLSPEKFPLQICGNYANDTELLINLESFVPGLIPLDFAQDVTTANVFQKIPLHTLFPLISIVS